MATQEIEALEDFIFFEEVAIRAMAGLIMPGGGKKSETRSFGKVIAVGPGRYTESGFLIPMRLKVGDLIVLGGNSTLVKYDHLDDKKVIRAIRQIEVSGIVKDSPAAYTHRLFDGDKLCEATAGGATDNDALVTCPSCVAMMAQLILS